MYDNRVRIKLNSFLGPLTLTDDDPIGYDQSETKIGRSEESHGIFITETNNLEFYGRAKRYLENLWKLKGVHASCHLTKEEKHPTTDEWEIRSTGYLNFYTRSIKDGKFQIDFVEGGLRELLVSQFRESFEMNRETDIKGNPISKLRTDTFVLKGRDMYLLSKLSGSDNFTAKSGIWRPNNYEYREALRPFPLKVDANSDPENIATPIETLGIDDRWIKSLANMFFVQADTERGNIKFNAGISFKIKDYRIKNAQNDGIKVVLDRYDENLNLVDRKEIADFPDVSTHIGETYNLQDYEVKFTSEDNTEVKIGESFGFGILVYGEFTGNLTSEGYLEVDFSEVDVKVRWAEDSFFRTTTSDCMTAFEVGKRLSEIYTGKPCFESYLLTGKDPRLLTDTNHQLVFSPGGWLRNLKKEVDIEDAQGIVTGTETKDWPMEFSMEDFYKSIHAILPVGYGISTVGKQQKIVFEGLRYFFQRVVTVKLGKITIKERSAANELAFQSLKFGYEKGGNYEEPLGLDEYNTRATTITPLTGTDNSYEAIGPSRTDSYGAEKTRRKPASEYPDEDTPADKDNFQFDVKKTGRINNKNVYEVRLWQDDFEEAPTGIYSPETAYNLNLSPGRNRKRHSFWFNNAIVQLKDEALQFVNNQGNSELKTKKAGEAALKENQPEVPITDLDKPKFIPEWIDGEAPYDQTIMDQLLGKTLINNRWINNYYGLAEFINEQNKKEYAFIYTVKAKDTFTYKLLKAYGV